MRWAIYERWVARYDAAEEMLDVQLIVAAARLMQQLQRGSMGGRPRKDKGGL
jgi:hypothetical protein